MGYFWRHILLGLGFGYPPCCVLRFAWTRKFDPFKMQALERGVCDLGERGAVFVPCELFHHAHRQIA